MQVYISKLYYAFLFILVFLFVVTLYYNMVIWIQMIAFVLLMRFTLHEWIHVLWSRNIEVIYVYLDPGYFGTVVRDKENMNAAEKKVFADFYFSGVAFDIFCVLLLLITTVEFGIMYQTVIPFVFTILVFVAYFQGMRKEGSDWMCYKELVRKPVVS